MIWCHLYHQLIFTIRPFVWYETSTHTVSTIKLDSLVLDAFILSHTYSLDVSWISGPLFQLSIMTWTEETSWNLERFCCHTFLDKSFQRWKLYFYFPFCPKDFKPSCTFMEICGFCPNAAGLVESSLRSSFLFSSLDFFNVWVKKKIRSIWENQKKLTVKMSYSIKTCTKSRSKSERKRTKLSKLITKSHVLPPVWLRW